MKRCPSCERTLPESAFHKNRSRSDGYATYCRPCMAEKVAARKARLAPRGETPERFAPHCPHCQQAMRKHVSLDVFYCVDPDCHNFDRAMHVRLYANGTRAA